MEEEYKVTFVDAHSRKFVNRYCQNCGKLFFAALSDVKRGYGKFCGHSCKQKKTWKREGQADYKVALKARNAAASAAESGRIKRTHICLVCGSKEGVQMHHDKEDYSEPLSIIELCTSCHRKRHYILLLISKWKAENRVIPLILCDP